MNPEYTISQGYVSPNSAANDLRKRKVELEREYSRLNCSYVGACLLHLVHKFAWIESVQMVMTSWRETNEARGSYLCISNNASELQFVQGQPVIDDQGHSLEPMGAGPFIEQFLWDDETDMFDVLSMQGALGEVTFTVARAPLQPLLERLAKGQQVDGSEAFLILFPDEAMSRGLAAPVEQEAPAIAF